MGRALGWGRARLCHGSRWRLLAAGALVTLGVTAVAASAATAVTALASALGWLGVLIEAVALKSTFSLRGLAASALRVAEDLERSDLRAARAAVGRDLVSRPTTSLDTAQVVSATVESVAENLTDAFVAPVFFYLLFGLPGAAFYRAVNTADAMIGYHDGPLEHFGKLAARLDDVLNLAPARVAALALVAGAALAGGDARGAWRTWRHEGRLTASPNAGRTMAAMAGALGVTLTKAGTYRLGSGRAPEVGDIGRALWLFAVAAALAVGALLVLDSVALFLHGGRRAAGII